MHYEVDSDIDTHRKYAEVCILRKNQLGGTLLVYCNTGSPLIQVKYFTVDFDQRSETCSDMSDCQ